MNLRLSQQQHQHQWEHSAQSIYQLNLLCRLLVYIHRSSKYFHLCLELLIQGLHHMGHKLRDSHLHQLGSDHLCHLSAQL